MPDRGMSGAVDQAAVRAALAELTEWEPMRRSPQLSAFLVYVVEAALRGEGEAIKAYSIAVDVFGRGADFDPQTDPIVRVQARRLRRLLDAFDDTGHGRAPYRIVIPRGRYLPEFLARDPEFATAPPAPPENDVPAVSTPVLPQRPNRSIWVAGAIAALMLLASLYYWPELGQRTGGTIQPDAPMVIIEEFENHTDDERGEPLVAGLAVELVTDLNLFPDILARYGGPQAEAREEDLVTSDTVYILSGVARRSIRGILYSVILREVPENAVRASYEIEVPFNGDGATLQDVSTLFALRLGNPRGPLHAPVRSWLESDAAQGVVFEPYPCMAAFWEFRGNRVEIDPTRIEACAEAGIAQGHWEAMAMLGLITADRGWRLGTDTAEGAALVEDGIALSDDAVDRDPISAFNWAMRGYVAFLTSEVAAARDFYNTAMQLNPAMIDVVADYAYVNGLLGNWDIADRLSADVLAADPDPPDFYHAVPALSALRRGDYAEAIAHGEPMAQGLPELGSAVMVAAGGALRDANVVNAYLPRLLASQRYRRLGILPALREHISDPDLMRQISTGILQAGVPLDRLAQPFT